MRQLYILPQYTLVRPVLVKVGNWVIDSEHREREVTVLLNKTNVFLVIRKNLHLNPYQNSWKKINTPPRTNVHYPDKNGSLQREQRNAGL